MLHFKVRFAVGVDDWGGLGGRGVRDGGQRRRRGAPAASRHTGEDRVLPGCGQVGLRRKEGLEVGAAAIHLVDDVRVDVSIIRVIG